GEGGGRAGEDEDEGDAVLDVGCGTGEVTASLLLPALPARVRRVVGADLSPAMVRYAGAQHRDPRLLFVEADIAAPDLHRSPLAAQAGPRGFFKLFSFYCLHLVDQRMALRNMNVLLAPGGEALLAFLAKCPIFNVYESLAKYPQWRRYMTDVRKYVSPYQNCKDPVREFSTLLDEEGFIILDCCCKELNFEYLSLECLRDAVTSVNPFIERIPEGERAQFVVDIMKEIITQKLVTFIEDDMQKKITFTYSLLVAFIEKSRN
ncbi:Juvenile hormone acid O-methyltransferase, partial [Gryllus bimaculatus]